MTPTQRTLSLVRKWGWLPAMVERWIPGAHIRRDAYGWIDALALDVASGRLWGVQSTGEDFAGHLAKLRGEAAPMVKAWYLCGGCALLVGWRPLKRGGRLRRVARYAVYAGESYAGESWVEVQERP